MFCLYFSYICPGAESNSYFYGMHSIGSDEPAHMSLLILICTVYEFIYICPCAKSNGYYHDTHSIVSDEVTHMTLLI